MSTKRLDLLKAPFVSEKKLVDSLFESDAELRQAQVCVFCQTFTVYASLCVLFACCLVVSVDSLPSNR